MGTAALDTIFKAYDVRGVYPDETDEDVCRRVGNAFVAFTGADRLVVARDMRPSSEPLSAAFIEGATLAGASVIDAGLASTDLIYFAAGSLDAPGAMFTANPINLHRGQVLIESTYGLGEATVQVRWLKNG